MEFKDNVTIKQSKLISRLIKKHGWNESFFAEETRCEYTIPVSQKKVWGVLIDMLLEFDKICKKHNIKYFLMFGSLLGAVRNSGFIPWDDDLDVGLLRADYDKLLSVKDEFKHPYFFQIPETDPGYYHTHAKIRQSDTTAFNPITGYEGFNQGIWLDVFPIDNYKEEDGVERYEAIKVLNIDEATQMRVHHPNLDEKNKKRVEEYLSRDQDPMVLYHKVEEIASMYKNDNTSKVSTISVSVYPLDKLVFDADDFSSAIYVDFENQKFPIPIGYKRVLETIYNDYMKFPPVEKRGLNHNETFDPETPINEFRKINNL